MALIGRTIDGKYRIAELIGLGGDGSVFKAFDEEDDRPVAVKILYADKSRDKLISSRFIAEARILYRLTSPHTARLLDFGQLEDGRHYMVMEYFAGGSLGDQLKGSRLELEPALRIAHQICLSLEEAHSKGIVHRDLKPENVLFDDVEGEGFNVKIVDFGLAKLREDAKNEGETAAAFTRTAKTSPRMRVGTPAYMAPEQISGGPVDHRTDLYALGAILFEMLTGHTTFESTAKDQLFIDHLKTAPSLMGEVAPEVVIPTQLEDLVAVLLAKRPEERLDSAKVVARIIEDVLGEMEDETDIIPIPMVRHTASPRPSATESRTNEVLSVQKLSQRRIWIYAGLLLATLLILLGLLLVTL